MRPAQTKNGIDIAIQVVKRAWGWVFELRGEEKIAQLAKETKETEEQAAQLEGVLVAMRKRAEARAKKAKLEREISQVENTPDEQGLTKPAK